MLRTGMRKLSPWTGPETKFLCLIPSDCSHWWTWRHNLQRWMTRCTSSKRPAWGASVAQHRKCSYLSVAMAKCFLYEEGAWRLPKPAILFGPEAMTTQHTQEQADMLCGRRTGRRAKRAAQSGKEPIW